MKPFILWILLHNTVFGRDDFIFGFIKDYIRNELAPTVLAYDLCWNEEKQISLYRLLSEDGVRISSKLDGNSKLLDQNLLFLVDLNCPAAENAFNITDQFRSPYRWLVIYDNTRNVGNDKRIIDQLWNLPLLTDSDFVLAQRKGNALSLIELHKPSPSGPTYSNPRGFYNGTLIDTRPRREMYWRRRDLMGHPLTMSNVIQDSNTTIHHLEDRLKLHHDPITKLCWIHVSTAFGMLNATARYVFSYRWGYIKDGQWSGMINDLRTGRADIGTNCVPNSKRLEVVVFTDSIGQFEVKFIFRQPPLSYVANIFALPFSNSVWIAIALSILVSTAAIYVASRWEIKRLGFNPTQLDGSVADALLLTMSAMSQQGCSKEPKGLSGRIMLWVIFAALMALYAAYAAHIVVLLQAPSSSIRTLEQLEQSGMTLGAIDTDYNRFVFRMFKDPVKQAIFKKVEPAKGKSHYYSLNEGVKKIRQGLFAYHSILEPVYRRVEETFLETEKCDLMEIDYMNARHPFVPIYKNSPYLELLRVALKRIRESGIQSALHRRLQVPKPKCSDKISSFSSVGLLNLRPVLCFMLYGIVLSIFIAVLENIIHKLLVIFS
ncbi:ionotropic receptor 75a-like [Zerene cesonia]|uniref:ionotropic receptor 75a-like n=1 Tax=Zerene cesonia TaxID=33412 RepID=UPI0018E58D0A|nr:ionotropic receptor 75a-like [Zerene cesonia]